MIRQAHVHALSLAVTVVMLGFAAGSSKSPSSSSPAGSSSATPADVAQRKTLNDYVAKMSTVYTRAAALMKTPAPDTACDGKKMLAKAPPDKNRSLRLQTIHGPYLARFASKDSKAWTPNKGPWSWLNDSLYSRFDKYPDLITGYTLQDTANYAIREQLLPRRYTIVVWPNDEHKNALPVMHTKDKAYDSGVFDGHLLVADVIDGTIECQKQISVRNRPKIRFIEEGLLAKRPEQALLDDFHGQMEIAIKEYLPPELGLETTL